MPLKELDQWDKSSHTYLVDIKYQVDLKSEYWKDYQLAEEVWRDGRGNWKKYYQKE